MRALRRPGLADLSPGVSPDEFGPNYGAAANDLNRIFRVSDAGWRRAPQFDAGFSETVLHLGITPVCFGIAKSIPRFFRRSPSGKAR